MMVGQLVGPEIAELTTSLLAEVGMTDPRGGLTCVRLGSASTYAGLARTLECQIFAADLNQDPEQTRDEFAAYEAGSHFFLALDARICQPVGVMRIVTCHSGRPKTLNDLAEVLPEAAVAAAWRHDGLSRAKVWDISSLAVAPEYRGCASSHAVSGMLYRSLGAAAVASSADCALMLICTATLARLRYFGMPMVGLHDLPPVTYPGLGQFHGQLLDLRNCMAQMRAFAEGLVAAAGPNNVGAQQRRDFIESVVTGAGIDERLAFPHGPLE